jgi:hypothetical protein
MKSDFGINSEKWKEKMAKWFRRWKNQSREIPPRWFRRWKINIMKSHRDDSEGEKIHRDDSEG